MTAAQINGNAPRPEIELSIIIVSWNASDFLRACLQALYANSGLRPADFEVHVVDNASTDGCADLVRHEFPQALLTANSENVGFARANNQVIGRCRGRLILLLNPDTALAPGALARLRALMDADPAIAVLGSRLAYADGTGQRNAGGAFPTLFNVAWNYLFLNRILPRWLGPRGLFLQGDPRVTTDTDWVSGAVMMLHHADVRERIFDERYFLFAEDMELCARFRAAGRRVVYAGEVTVLHHHGQSMIRQSSPEILSLAMEAPRAYFAQRHGRITLGLYDLLLFAGCSLRCVIYLMLGVLRPGAHYRRPARTCGQRSLTALGWLLGAPFRRTLRRAPPRVAPPAALATVSDEGAA